jgi:glycosyltransferase involved in cell wall biosynthesis
MILKNIKIVINNRNRLTTTKNMVEKLLSINPDEEIIIIDNASTYPQLLEWYKQIMDKVMITFRNNEGHLALWSTGLYKELGEYFIYTDADIILPQNLPLDWKEIMFNTMMKYPEFKKIALGLRIDDLPENYLFKLSVMKAGGGSKKLNLIYTKQIPIQHLH